MKNNLKKIRELRGLTQEGLAAKIVPPTSRSVIVNLEKGINKLHSEWLRKLSIALHCAPEELIADSSPVMVPVVGYVGAGSKIYPIDDYPTGSGFDEVEPPPGINPSKTVAVTIRGDSMHPVFQDGWTVFYDKKRDVDTPPRRDGLHVPYNKSTGEPLSEFFNKPCVVKLKDGSMYLKTLKRGSRPGVYNLVSYNAPDIEDAALEWAAKIIFIKTS